MDYYRQCYTAGQHHVETSVEPYMTASLDALEYIARQLNNWVIS